MDSLKLMWLGILLHVQMSNGEECACATGNVHIRSGAGTTHSILGTLTAESCLAFKGHMTTISGTHWANVDYQGQVRKQGIVLLYIHFIQCAFAGIGDNCDINVEAMGTSSG